MRQIFDDIKSYSKATIVSVCNFPISEKKIGLIPSEYPIPPAPLADIAIFHVDDAVYFSYIDDARGSYRNITPAYRVGQSIIEDFVQAQLAVDSESRPGLMVLEGAYSKDEVKKQFAEELLEIRKIHKKWAERLVAIGDDFWTVNQKRSAISERSRDAARFLNVERVWLNVAPTMPAEVIKFKSCPVCFENVNEKAIVCRACHTVLDPVAYAKFQKIEAVPAEKTA